MSPLNDTESDTARDRMRGIHADIVDTLRALDNGRPVPAHVHRNARERAKQNVLRDLRSARDL
ncbi:hypothetical protein ACFW9D_05840 [Streptomyces sp. NPDC059524]|uniref:hypothetical protein n=1 Tax=Streptomyces sp. NPDC059524 TaxID=3346856 RepID=UPI003681598C